MSVIWSLGRQLLDIGQRSLGGCQEYEQRNWVVFPAQCRITHDCPNDCAVGAEQGDQSLPPPAKFGRHRLSVGRSLNYVVDLHGHYVFRPISKEFSDGCIREYDLTVISDGEGGNRESIQRNGRWKLPQDLPRCQRRIPSPFHTVNGRALRFMHH
jgi:hypothetical protein